MPKDLEEVLPDSLIQMRFLNPLILGPSVLEPGKALRLSQTQTHRKTVLTRS